MDYTLHDANGRILGMCGCLPEELDAYLVSHGATGAVEGCFPWGTHYIENGAAVPFTARPAPTMTWDWAAKVWVDARQIGQVKIDKWAEIKAEREQRLAGAGVTPLATFDSATAEQRANLSGVALMLIANPQVDEVNYTCADDVRRTFARADFMAAASLVGAQVQALFDAADTLRQQIDAATTIEEVDAVAWPA